MSKAIKKGQVIQNRHGQFAKVIDIKNGFYFLAGWFGKKSQANEAESRTMFVNGLGLARAMGDAEQAITDSNESFDPKDDDANSDGDTETNTDADADPFDGFTNADLKDALKENDLPVSGNRSELTARLQENGIELVAE